MRLGQRPGPGVRSKSRASSRISRYALALKAGFARSNALRMTMLIEPASAMPGDSGVGEKRTSMRARLFVATFVIWMFRAVFACALAWSKPFTVTGV